VHALHTVHAVPDLRVAAGRLRDKVLIEISISFVVVAISRNDLENGKTATV